VEGGRAGEGDIGGLRDLRCLRGWRLERELGADDVVGRWVRKIGGVKGMGES